MKVTHILVIFMTYLLIGQSVAAQFPSEYNIVWNTPSTGSHESMPCGGGSIGMNVWVEKGSLYFYFSRSGTFDANNTFLKGGRVRLELTPNPFESEQFSQELKLQDGYVEIIAGKGKERTLIELWADVFQPVINLDIKSKQAIKASVSYESWRFEDLLLRKDESHSNSYKFAPPAGLIQIKDSVYFEGNGVEFCHRNGVNTVFDVAVERQGMNEVKHEMMNPLANLNFGGKMYGVDFKPKNIYTGVYQGTPFKGWTLESNRLATSHQIKIALCSRQSENLTCWKEELYKQIAKAEQVNKTAKKKTRAWWNSFWDRSFIRINPGGVADEAWKVGRNYQLFRYMLACNAYGSEPTKFNGGLFTFDPVFVDSTRAFTPDFRLWGGGTMTAQNQRLVYFPMLKSGDFDLMAPQFNFYERMLRNAELRSLTYWGHAGACFTEQIENFGLPNLSEYAWKPRADGFPVGVESNPWLEYTWDTALEFALMMFDAYSYNNEPIEPHLPFIESVLTFFDEHYRYLAARRGTSELDGEGHLVLYPGSGCETYKMATNATSTIAALKVILERLLELPGLSADQRERWTAISKRIPPINFREIGGKKLISPAKIWERINNSEVPQLYPVYPWRIYGVERPDLDIAINTYFNDPDALSFRSHVGWKQDNIFAACLGLTDEASRLTLLKMGDGPCRFPAFWGPGFDWTPDHNWGGSGMIGLQEMLLQTVGDSILLFPAWPSEWDVHFKLHAPGQTVIEAELKNGKLEMLNVIPESRRKDVILYNQNFSSRKAGIYLNQVGYLPEASKYAIVDNTRATTFSVVNTQTESIVYKGDIINCKQWDMAAEELCQADFSSLHRMGQYYIDIEGVKSPSFFIEKDIYHNLSLSLMKSYYYQRCSFPLAEKFAGQWKRNAGHADTNCIFHESTGRNKGMLASPGGWYDAGDYGKYVVNAGISVGTLLTLIEQFPMLYPDGSLNIPESGNGKNDLLDEVKYELDWLLTMQDTDGGVFFKLTTKSFCGFVMPEYDQMDRYIIGKTTSSTLNFAAVMAMAGRIYKDYDRVFANQCLVNAEKAWIWAMTTPESYFKNPADVFTGEYGDRELKDEYLWAAAELAISTGKKAYVDYLEEQLSSNAFDSNLPDIPSWANVRPLALIDLALNGADLPHVHRRCQDYVIQCANKIRTEIAEHPLRIPCMSFNWGSNSHLANYGLYLIYAYKLTLQNQYMAGVMQLVDYFLGKNVTGYSFITGFGTKQPMHPHHRPSGADSVKQPVPGLVVGGSNGGLNDEAKGVVYPKTIAPAAYVDALESYASNEVAINWNAPVVVVFSVIDYVMR